MPDLVPESQGGKHLVQRCDINAGAQINCLFRIKCKPSVSPMLSREIQMAVTERRHVTYFGICITTMYTVVRTCDILYSYIGWRVGVCGTLT